MPEIQNINHTHHAIARWLVANPTSSLRECADFFGYTQSWLSTIIHSDAFKRLMCELQGGADDATIADVPAKLRGVASLALDALGDQLDNAVRDGAAHHREFVKSTAEMALKSLGYGQVKTQAPSPAPAGVNVNILNVSPEVIARARARMLPQPSSEGGGIADLVPEVKEVVHALPQAEELSPRP